VGREVTFRNPEGYTLRVPDTYDAEKYGAYREGVWRREIGRNAGSGANSTEIRRNSPVQRAARRSYPLTVEARPITTAPGGRGWALDHIVELQHDLTGTKGTHTSHYRWQDSAANSLEGSRSWALNSGPQGVPAGGVARVSQASRWYHQPGFRAAGRGVGRGLVFVGAATAVYDMGRATEASVREGTPAPVAAESIRQAGGWAGGWLGFKVGFLGGAALGVETGPGLVVTGLIGGIVLGMAGYFGADWVADHIHAN
jgi:hypothetical protein